VLLLDDISNIISNSTKRDNFNYTQWQRNLWKDKSIDEINEMAIQFQKEKKFK
jgi:hypothetical protein